MKGKILITGASGNVGSHVLEYLISQEKSVVAATRMEDKESDRELLEYRQFDLIDPSTWSRALDGVSRVFLMRPPPISNIRRDMLPFIKYMKEMGIHQVVFLSVQGAENNKIVPHHKVEQALLDLEIPCTLIRPSFFMQNLTTTHLEEIRDEKRIFVPTGKGKTNFIDTRDIGEICARVFLDEKYINQAYTITGETSYTHGEIAEFLSRGLNEEIRFVDPNSFQFVNYHLRKGRKLAMTLVMLALYSVVKSNKGNVTTGDSEKILSRKTISLEQFIQDHRALFLGNE
jgi:uncharacterized protein YbjT (DUF2867 family)